MGVAHADEPRERIQRVTMVSVVFPPVGRHLEIELAERAQKRQVSRAGTGLAGMQQPLIEGARSGRRRYSASVGAVISLALKK